MSGKDEHAYKIEFNTAIHQIKIEYTYCTLGIARHANYIHYTAFASLVNLRRPDLCNRMADTAGKGFAVFITWSA